MQMLMLFLLCFTGENLTLGTGFPCNTGDIIAALCPASNSAPVSA